MRKLLQDPNLYLMLPVLPVATHPQARKVITASCQWLNVLSFSPTVLYVSVLRKKTQGVLIC